MRILLPIARGDPVLVVDNSTGERRELWAVVVARQVRFVKVMIWDHDAGVVGEFEERLVRPIHIRRPGANDRALIKEHFSNYGYDFNE